MTEKELHRLSRQDLLELLLTQSREVAQQKSVIEEMTENLSQEKALTGRLKDRLNDKDETIEHLKHRLDDKDESLNRLKAEAKELREEMESMRERLSDKDLALDIARARMDCMQLNISDAPASEHSDRTAEEKEARLLYLRELLQKSKAAAERLRKATE